MATNTSASPNFASILDEAPTEIIRPQPLPVGTYLCVVGAPEDTISSQKKTPGVKFPLKPIMAMEDVNEDDLNDMGGLENKNLNITFWLTPDSAYRLDDFHSHCGLDITQKLSRRMRNSEVVNSQVLAVVSHRMSDDNTQTFAEVRRTARAD